LWFLWQTKKLAPLVAFFGVAVPQVIKVASASKAAEKVAELSLFAFQELINPTNIPEVAESINNFVGVSAPVRKYWYDRCKPASRELGPQPTAEGPDLVMKIGEVNGLKSNSIGHPSFPLFGEVKGGLQTLSDTTLIGPITSSNPSVIAVFGNRDDSCGPGSDLASCHVYAIRVGEADVCGLDSGEPTRQACLTVRVPEVINVAKGTVGLAEGSRFLVSPTVEGIPSANDVTSSAPHIVSVSRTQKSDFTALARNTSGTSDVCVQYTAQPATCQTWNVS